MGWSVHHPVGLIHYSPSRCYRGYTLLCTGGGQQAFLIDVQGRVCYQWRSAAGIEYYRLLPNGNLLLRTNPPRDVEVGNIGGASAALQELDWDSTLVWEFRHPMLHHDFQRLPNGNTLICEGAPGRIFEVTPDAHIVWEYINPYAVLRPSRLARQTEAGVMQGAASRTGATEWENAVLRAHRYGPDHPALQGRDLKPDAMPT